LASPTNPINCGYDGISTDCITSTTTANVTLRVPYLGISPADYVFGPDESYKYNSLQATVRKQFSHGLQFQAAYTFSRAFSTGAGAIGPVQEYLGVNNQSYPIVSAYQQNTGYHPHRLTASYSYDLPFGHPSGLMGKVATGWSVSGVITIQDGVPLSVTDATGGAIFGSPLLNGSLAQFSGTARPSLPGGVSKKVDHYLNYAAFTDIPLLATPGCSMVAPVTCGKGFGNSGYGIALGPGQNNWDLSLTKTTTVGGLNEGATLQFRAEFFNAFNHPQFTNPGNSTAVAWTATNASTFANITALSVNPRLIQFALKYQF
jgi:hypothetical protein